MIKVNKHPEYGWESVSGYLIIKLDADLSDELKGKAEITEHEAMSLLRDRQEELATSNDGSELLANAKISLIKPELPPQ